MGVDPDGECRGRSYDLREIIARDDSIDGPDTLWFESYETLYRTFTPEATHLLGVVRAQKPQSIRAAARLVERNVSNVHRELTAFARLGVIDLVESDGAKRPVFPYDRLLIDPSISPTTTSRPDDARA